MPTPLSRVAITAAFLITALLGSAAAASAAPILSVDVAHVSTDAIQARVGGHANPRLDRVVLAALASAGDCPDQPTAAARLLRSPIAKDGAWQRTIRLDTEHGGLSADAPRDLAAERLHVCVWRLGGRTRDAHVIARAQAATKPGFVEIAQRYATLAAGGLLTIVAILAAARLTFWVRRRRRAAQADIHPAAEPVRAPATLAAPRPAALEHAAAAPAQPAAAAPQVESIARRYTRGTDGSISWEDAPDMPDVQLLSSLLNAKLGDPRMN